VQHKGSNGALVTTLGDNVKQEMEFVLVEQYEKPLKEKGVDFKTQTLWLEVLVAADSDPSKQWANIAAINEVVADYFGDNRPAGATYPVSWIPNLDGIVEPQPRCVVGEDISIERSGKIVDGYSTWTSFTHSGVREVMTSGVGGDDAGVILGTIDSYIKEAGGAGLKENGIFNNAYVVAKDSSAASREWIVEFNKSFTAYYEGSSPAGRTAQFIGGYMDEKYPCGISSRAMFTV
jgi:enamine deaminase RidA (YjgF/YER057c/UK114 family)